MKNIHPKCFKTTNFDTYYVKEQCWKCVSNLNFAIYNALPVVPIGSFQWWFLPTLRR